MAGLRDLVRDYVRFFVEENLIKYSIETIERLERARNIKRARNLRDDDSGNVRLEDLQADYGDVLLHDWSQDLHQRIQYLIEYPRLARLQDRPRESSLVRAALQWRLNRITQRRTEAGSNLPAFNREQQALMFEFLPLIRNELIWTNPLLYSEFHV